MRALVLGGGGFLGYHAVVDALGRGDEVTVLSRSGRPPVDGVEVVVGDRLEDDGLAGLRGREWDAVFDTFDDTRPGAPAIRAAAGLLSGSVGAYAYVSGMSVYAPAGPAVPDESGPVRRAGVEPQSDRLQERSLAKLAGEAAVREAFDGPSLFPRVGIMVGPRGRRFNYWPARLALAVRGVLPRRVVVPGDPDRSVQYSDGRDIVAWVWTMLAAGRGGVYNTVGPGRPDTLRDVLDACARAVGATPESFDWVTVADEDLMRRELVGVDEEERPLWYPEDQIPQTAIDSGAAVAAGLRFRPAEQTAREVWEWMERNDDLDLTRRFVAWEPRLIGLDGR